MTTNGYDGMLAADDFNAADVKLNSPSGWLGNRVVSVLDSGAEALGSNRSRNAVG